MDWEVNLLLNTILDILSENKGENVLSISLKGKSEQADYMVITTGSSNRHVTSLSEKIIATLKKQSGVCIRTEGLNNSDWVLIDSGDVIIHIFREEVREFYQLEKLWEGGNYHNANKVNF